MVVIKITCMACPPDARDRNTDSIHHHHHPEGLVYGGFCINSGTVAVSKSPPGGGGV